MKTSYKQIKRVATVVGLVLGAFAVSAMAANWAPPSQQPPNCTVDAACNAPLNVSSAWQGKLGPLAVGTLNMPNPTPSLFVSGGSIMDSIVVNGSMRYTGGNLKKGQILTDTDGQGNISWSGGDPQEGQVLTYKGGNVVWTTINNSGGGGGNPPPVCSGSQTFTTSYMYWKGLPACATNMVIKLYGGGGGGSYYIRNSSPGEGGAGGHYKEIKVRPVATDQTRGLIIHVANWGKGEGQGGDVDADQTQWFGLGAGAPNPNNPTQANCSVGGIHGDSSHVDRESGASRVIVSGFELNPNQQGNQLAQADGGAGGGNCGVSGSAGKSALGPLGGAGGVNGGPGQQPGGGGGSGNAATASPLHGGAGGHGMVIIEWSDAPWN